MIREKNCIICGKAFSTEHKNKKYCSLVCKDAALRIKKMKWRQENPGYMTEYMKKYRAKVNKE